MQLTKLSLTNFRIFEQAEFEFQPGMNLIVGINGAGKSTVLNALRTSLSHVMPLFTISQSQRRSLNKYDITLGKTALVVDIQFTVNNVPFRCELTMGQGQRPTATLRPNSKTILEPLIKNPQQPLALYFSPRRSIPSSEAPSTNAKAKGPVAAYASALWGRELRLREFADWWLVQKALADESDRRAKKRLKILEETTHKFLDTYAHLQVVGTKSPVLKLQKGTGVLDIHNQFSDGERGMLALALDISRRLILANPELKNPTQEGQAVVLIDELDLHLHPRWQREIVGKLVSTFPQCQFIATTHSPFVIQSLHKGKLINIGSEDIDEYADKSIEDITENIMGIPMPQKSERYSEMMKAAEEYFRLLHSAKEAPPEEKERLKNKLDELSMPFSDDPAFTALLKVERETALAEK